MSRQNSQLCIEFFAGILLVLVCVCLANIIQLATNHSRFYHLLQFWAALSERTNLFMNSAFISAAWLRSGSGIPGTGLSWQLSAVSRLSCSPPHPLSSVSPGHPPVTVRGAERQQAVTGEQPMGAFAGLCQLPAPASASCIILQMWVHRDRAGGHCNALKCPRF